MIEWTDIDKRRYFLIGPLLFTFIRLGVYPFNLIKTRLFMQEHHSIYNGTLDAFYKVVKYEGIRGLYKGYFVSLLGLVSGQVYIVTYEIARSQLKGYSTEVKGLVGGTCATLGALTITVPVDVISQHRMMQGQVQQWKKGSQENVRLPSTLRITQKIWEKSGIRGFFRGYSVSLLTYAPNSALWWSLYSGFFKRSMESKHSDRLPLPLIQAGCGMSAGTLASVATNSLDVIRTRFQVRPPSLSPGTNPLSWFHWHAFTILLLAMIIRVA